MTGTFHILGSSGLTTRQVELGADSVTFSEPSEAAAGYLVPGFVDLHIHGAFGIDFMSATRAEMVRLAGQLEEIGYEAFLPTTVSASAEDVLRALENLPEDIRMPGFHLEGPFVSPKYPGAQPPSAIVDPPAPGSEWDEVLGHPKLRIVTLAPERPGAPELIARLAKRGVIVSMGHTDATFAQAAAGFARGMRHSTHTFNAMRGLHHREGGALGFALSEDALLAELIYDREHVSREAAEILFRTKPQDGVLAVSDSTLATGLSVGERRTMWGMEIEVRDKTVVLAGTRTLAGSAITLQDAFRHLSRDFGPERAIRATSLNPRHALAMTAEPRIWVQFDSGFRFVAVHRIV